MTDYPPSDSTVNDPVPFDDVFVSRSNDPVPFDDALVGRAHQVPSTALSFILLITFLLTGSGLLLVGANVRADALGTPSAVLRVPEVDPVAQTTAAIEVLNRRAQALRDKDKEAFLADVDISRPDVLAAQTRQFENLTRLPLASFGYRVEQARYELKRQDDAFAGYRGAVFVPAVTIAYRIDGVSATETATPYLPVFGRVADRWLLVGEAADSDVDEQMPWGFGTQPWQGDLIEVTTGANAVLVYSPQDADRAAGWLSMVDKAVRDVRAVRPDKWSGKVFVIAVRDKRLITQHMGKKVDDVAAIAVEQGDRISAWSVDSTPARLASSVVLINPSMLGRSNEDFEFVLRHEVTHVAMDPVEGDHHAPLWLVEGFAEWVASGADSNLEVTPVAAKENLGKKDLTSLPEDATFRDDGGQNYLAAWVACDLIAKRYGKDKLFAFYEAFQFVTDTNVETRERVFKDVLGVSMADFTAAWRGTIQDAISRA